MRNGLSALVLGALIVFWAFPTYSQTPVAATETGPAKSGWAEAEWSLAAGYRTDQLNWSIAGNLEGNSPTVLSELSWSDIRILQLKLANRTVIKDRLYVRGHLDYGTVLSGSNRDSDYAGDNRTQEFSRSLNGVDGNHVWDGSVGIGPRFSFLESALVICPMLGYAVSEQDFNIVDGYQAFSAPPGTTPLGPIAGLNSRYQTRWEGFWLGVDLLFSIPLEQGPFPAMQMVLSGEFHRFDYDATATWNLRQDFSQPTSFTHQASGSGLAAGATILLALDPHWGVNFGMNLKKMSADAGVDRVYYTDGTTRSTRLNEVRWRAFTIEAGVSYQF